MRIELPFAKSRLTPADRVWPTALDDLKRPPAVLEVGGRLPSGPRVAIVGTRAADREANAFAHRLAGELASAGIVVVSGGALGVDAAAHRGCLDAGGQTIAVLASGLEYAYPPAHTELFGDIAHRGALLCEPHPARSGARFIHRNRIIAALCPVVVMVQAPVRSGAISTARMALSLGRSLLVVPVAPWDRRGAGNRMLLPKAHLCLNAEDVFDAMGMKVRRSSRSPDEVATREPVSSGHPILRALSSQPRTIDELVEATGTSAPELQAALFELMLGGQVAERPEGWVRT